MPDHRQIYLDDLIFRTNMLLDRNVSASFEDIYREIDGGTIIEWLRDKGTDLSILLSQTMADEKALVVAALAEAANSRKGQERRKLGVETNGLCLVIALALEAKAISQPITSPYMPDTAIQ